MSWRDRHPMPQKTDDMTDEEYSQLLEEWQDAEDQDADISRQERE